MIGIREIKQRRLRSRLRSHPNLRIGDCVPFFFCPRSPMLYMIAEDEEEGLEYHGGEDPILHLQTDLHETIMWANSANQRWAFTRGNAGEAAFDDYASLDELDRVRWELLPLQPWQTDDWPTVNAARKSEFLLERHFPWKLVKRIGCKTVAVREQVNEILATAKHKPPALLIQDWYHWPEGRHG